MLHPPSPPLNFNVQTHLNLMLQIPPNLMLQAPKLF